jgi:hypothetical protein
MALQAPAIVDAGLSSTNSARLISCTEVVIRGHEEPVVARTGIDPTVLTNLLTL